MLGARKTWAIGRALNRPGVWFRAVLVLFILWTSPSLARARVLLPTSSMNNAGTGHALTLLTRAMAWQVRGHPSLAALIPGGKKKKAESAEPETTKVSAKFPTLTPLGETSASQTKSGITIAIAPVEYKLTPTYESRVRRISPGFKDSLLSPHAQGDIFVERTCIPSLKVTPDRLRFQVTVSNQMPRVFHGAGLVVQFNVDGKLVATDEKGYSELANSIIPPRSQRQFEIYGPDLNTLPEQGAITLFFYDMVTNVDSAGNVSERQNFQWDFQFTTQIKEEEMEIPPPDKIWIGPGRGVGACVVGASLAPR